MMKQPNMPKPETLAKNPLLCPTCGASRDIHGFSAGRILARCRTCDAQR